MLAVTTRNKLHSARFFLPMLRARRYVREQLMTTPGLVRYASAIASPTEFLTFTVWENRQAMFNFMSAGAHQSFMWMFSRWSESFWSMRWLPTVIEDGTWDGLSLASKVESGDRSWREAHPEIPQLPLPEQRPARTPGRRVIDPGTSDVSVITALVEIYHPGHVWAALNPLRNIRSGANYPQLLRWSVGSIDPRRFLILTLWRGNFEEPTEVVSLLRQRLKAQWIMRWTAGEYEIGHWNGLRIRQLAAAHARQQRQQTEHIESTYPDPR